MPDQLTLTPILTWVSTDLQLLNEEAIEVCICAASPPSRPAAAGPLGRHSASASHVQALDPSRIIDAPHRGQIMFKAVGGQAIVSEAIGYCIYCGDRSPGNLSREHVIPFGLGGGLILRDASCKSCGKITGGFEDRCLNKNFGMVRAHIGMKSQNRKTKRPTHGDVILINRGIEERRSVPLNMHPNVLFLPSYTAVPGLLSGASGPSEMKRFISYKTEEAALRAAQHGAANVAVDLEFEMPPFERMLAKIAHGMMYMSYDTTHVEPQLLDIILKGDVGSSWRLIGVPPAGLPRLEIPQIGTHHTQCARYRTKRGEIAILVMIQLFAEAGATGARSPTYCVVAGFSSIVPEERVVRQPGSRAKKNEQHT